MESFLNLFPWETAYVQSNPFTAQWNTTAWKSEFDFHETQTAFFANYQWIFILGAILYLPAVYIGIKMMESREPFKNLKPFLFAWNLLVSVLSGIGAYRVNSFLLSVIITEFHGNIQSQVCDHMIFTEYHAGWWVFIFNVTKGCEWIDTLFLILSKKPVITLHWLHHILTMLYCWEASRNSSGYTSSGMWFAGMNLFVHAVMYGYYALRSLYSMMGYRFTLFNPLIITVLQISQMVMGLIIVLLSTQCPLAVKYNSHGILFGLTMYGIYFYMFLKLFLDKSSARKMKRQRKIESCEPEKEFESEFNLKKYQ